AWPSAHAGDLQVRDAWRRVGEIPRPSAAAVLSDPAAVHSYSASLGLCLDDDYDDCREITRTVMWAVRLHLSWASDKAKSTTLKPLLKPQRHRLWPYVVIFLRALHATGPERPRPAWCSKRGVLRRRRNRNVRRAAAQRRSTAGPRGTPAAHRAPRPPAERG